MADTQSNTKRLVRNTLSMYIRMLFLMFISFYTSRVLLHTLGVEDFGIYNLVGGIVVLFTFLNGAMTTGTQRHLSYELGRPDGNVSRIFSACMYIHLFLALMIIVMAETAGLWFLNEKMNFPSERMVAVNWIYQFSILSCAIQIIRVPYNALIIAYERMSFYAYLGIVEGLMKLGIIYLLLLGSFDRLILYAILMVAVNAIITLVFYLYCRKYMSEVSLIQVKDQRLYKNLLSFSGWTIFGSLANIGRSQGLNIIINIFYGVTLNAAIGIANQVNAGISQFVSGFQQAFNPQLTKAEAQQDRAYQEKLINMTAKYSYLIVLFFAVPILINLDAILSWWLGEYPPYAVEICFWIVIATLIDSVSGPLWVTIFAHGRIRNYQLVVSLLFLLILPMSYICGYFGAEPQVAFACSALLNAVAVAVRVLFMYYQIGFSIYKFLKETITPLMMVSAVILVALYSCNFLSMQDDVIESITITFIIVLVTLASILYIGIDQSERYRLFSLIKNRFLHI